jgi:TatD DNase family protein
VSVAAEPPAAATPGPWFDHHCHLGPDDAAGALAAAQAAGVARLVTVGTDAARSGEALAIARAHPGVVWATAGVHPHEARHGGVDVVAALLDEPEVVAVGECGLDYYYDHSPRDRQRQVFADQIGLARERGLPLVVHTRDAWDDTIDVLAAEGVPERTVIHCFTGGPVEARRCLDLGAHLSFSGIVTFKNAVDVRAAAIDCPLDRLLVETDAPYLAPVPHRGRPNQPAFVAIVGRSIAEARGMGAAELAAVTWSTTSRFYGLAEVPAAEPAASTPAGGAPGAPAPGGASFGGTAPSRATPNSG